MLPLFLPRVVLIIYGERGIDMYIWEKYKVNYQLIFDFNPRHHTTYQYMFEVIYLDY